MKNVKTVSPDYYEKALQAIDRADFETAKQLCIGAADQFEKAQIPREASVAYHLLGGVAYQMGDLKDAESWYLRSLSHIEPPDSETQIDYARTCNNLAAVANALGEYTSAEEWLSKSISIKSSLGDKHGLAASYHQMGIVTQTQSNLAKAHQWYLKSLSIEEEMGNIQGMVATLRCLANLAEERFGVNATSEWYRKATDALDKGQNPSIAERLGDEAQRDGDFRAAAILYKKAYDLAKRQNADATAPPGSLRRFFRCVKAGKNKGRPAKKLE